jgi:ornithine cyclodeaminase
LGSGVQASAHLNAMGTVRTLRRVRVSSSSLPKAQAFASHHEAALGVRIEPVATAKEAVLGADLICTATASHEPVLFSEWISAGAHINAVGACFATARELDTATVVRSRLYVDRRESALAEAGDFLIPRSEGAIDDGHIVGEIGDILDKRVAARRADDEITLFKSLGIAIEDLAAAHLIHARARAAGKGIAVDFGGHRIAYD